MGKQIGDYFKQNDDGLLPDIQRVGCFFRSALHCVELAKHCVLTKDDINFLWKRAKEKQLIDADNNLKNSAKLMNLALNYLDENNKAYFAEIGLKTNGVCSLYGWADSKGLVPNFYIRKIRQGGPSVYHFVVMDNNDRVIFEPHEPAIHSLGEVYTICYRYFDI